jgi:serine/threonine-protein kinase
MKTTLLNNRYRILETLGRGGFGETYLAEDTHMPSGRKCVIKQLKPIIEQPNIPLWMKERFQREAAILEQLGEGHPQIPCLYAYFSEEDKFYLVQEWIEGVTLAEKWEEQGNLSEKQVKQILISILPVLDYVHSRRIIHRDIKPENIILRDSDSLPVLIDFGAVKEAMATVVNERKSSAFSASIGTPGYMPSEQAAGRPVYSSDLYSLGLTAIFLLTGKSPHDLDSDPQTGEIVWQQYASKLNPQIVSLLERAIKFHPRDRFSSAQQMLTALQSGSNANIITGATVKVAPGKSFPKEYFQQTSKKDTVAVATPSSPKQKSNNWVVNLLLLILLVTGLTGGAFIAGFNALSSFWRFRSLSSPQAKVQPSPSLSPKSTNPPLKPEARENQDSIFDPEALRGIIKLNKEKKSPLEAEENPENPESELPEIVVDTKPGSTSSSQAQPEIGSVPVKPEPENTPQPEINVPIPTTGTSESKLVSALGQPTFHTKDSTSDSYTLVYQDIVPKQVNLSYKSDREGQIRQADVALAQSISLGSMQQTLTELLAQEPPVAIKEKLRQVYLRQTDFSFFKVNNLEGKIQRDSKDRVTISVWETGFQ